MKPSIKKILIETKIGRMFLVLWIGGVASIAARIVFEIKTIRGGSTFVCRKKSGDYLFHVPPGIKPAGHRYPLLIYLHGAGERNRSVRCLAKSDLVRYAGPVARSNDFPFIVVSPKTDEAAWEPDRVVALLDELIRNKKSRWQIDPTRIYLTGFSMGGFGVWTTAAKYPDRFTAIVPVAGDGHPTSVDRFASLPVWAFHGELDDVVPCESSVEMLETLWFRYPEAPDMYRLTVYPDADHGIPLRVYRNPELYRWLLKFQITKKPSAPP